MDCDCKFLAVGGDHVLIECFYKAFNIKTKFIATIKYRSSNFKTHHDKYVSSY